MTSPSTPVVPPFQPNPAAAPVMGMAAPMQQQRPPLATSFLPTTKPVQPVPPMQLMSQQQPPMFSGGGMNPVMGTVGAPGMLTNTNRMSTWSDVKGSVNISLDSLSPHSKLQPREHAGPTLSQMQQSSVQMNSLTMQMGQTNLGGVQSMPMTGMMAQQQQMGFGGGVVGPTPPFSEMTSPTSAAKQTLQKKADQAFADLAVFK